MKSKYEVRMIASQVEEYALSVALLPQGYSLPGTAEHSIPYPIEAGAGNASATTPYPPLPAQKPPAELESGQGFPYPLRTVKEQGGGDLF